MLGGLQGGNVSGEYRTLMAALLQLGALVREQLVIADVEKMAVVLGTESAERDTMRSWVGGL